MSARRGGSLRAQVAAAVSQSGDGEGTHGANWAVSYGDMVTLLLSFFVLSYGGRETMKVQLLEKALTKAGVASPIQPTKRADSSVGGLEQAWKKVSNLHDARATRDGRRLIVEFPGVSFFGFRETGLSAEGARLLARFGEVFRPEQARLKLTVIAYTDAVPVRAGRSRRYADNLELSALRGVSAVRYLAGLGIDRGSMRVGGDGEWRGPAPQGKQGVASGSYSRKVVLMVEPQENDL